MMFLFSISAYSQSSDPDEFKYKPKSHTSDDTDNEDWSKVKHREIFESPFFQTFALEIDPDESEDYLKILVKIGDSFQEIRSVSKAQCQTDYIENVFSGWLERKEKEDVWEYHTTALENGMPPASIIRLTR